jgi:hypothetical protein
MRLPKIRKNFFWQILLCALSAFFVTEAEAGIIIPKNLNDADREAVLKIIGLGTSGKLLSDPYPMGGYSGFEVGLSVESLPTDDLAKRGAGLTTSQQEVAYPKLTVGKGLYNGVDLFLDFTPYSRQGELTQFGGMLRWSFFEAESLPLSASFLLHLDSANVGGLLATHTYGGDLIVGINVDDAALFAGIGSVEAAGTFASDITSSGQSETARVWGVHTVIGANVHFLETFFLALEIDRYTVPVFSGKLGMRF